jgi:hypothetical protein
MADRSNGRADHRSTSGTNDTQNRFLQNENTTRDSATSGVDDQDFNFKDFWQNK